MGTDIGATRYLDGEDDDSEYDSEDDDSEDDDSEMIYNQRRGKSSGDGLNRY